MTTGVSLTKTSSWQNTTLCGALVRIHLLNVDSCLRNANADWDGRRQLLICSRKDIWAEQSELDLMLGLRGLSRKDKVHDYCGWAYISLGPIMDPWLLIGHQADVEPLIPEQIFPLWLIAIAGHTIFLNYFQASSKHLCRTKQAVVHPGWPGLDGGLVFGALRKLSLKSVSHQML